MKHKEIIIAIIFLMSDNVYAQEYTYDANGNLSGDSNKEITFIHYNHLNLADTIKYADGRRMIYTYTASGQKLREQSVLSNGAIKQKRDYAGTILYRNDSLQEIKHEDGRVIPGQEAEYQYHLTDHLGNVRTTLTSKQEVDNSTATYETENAATEQNKYLRYNVARRVNTPLFDHTHNGITFYSERLNGSANEKYGIARSLSVMPGDTIKLEVFAKYVDQNSSNWTQALTTLLTQITAGTAPVGTVVDGTNYATNGTTPFPFAGLNNTANSTGAGPKAYLNWLVFDRNFLLKTGGYVKMTDAAKENGTNVTHERLSTELTIKEAGYVYVYLSNEETTPKEVYFDDLSVAQVKGPIVQESDYDPFGLTFNEYTRENATPNSFLYNGKELQSDFELNWYDYGARMYDAALGRWHVIDAMAEKYTAWSPYNYVMNNPVKLIDPDGNWAVIAYKKDNGETGYHLFDGSSYTRNLPTDRGAIFIKHFIQAYDYNNANAAKINNKGGESLRKMVTAQSLKLVVQQGDAEYPTRSDANDPTQENSFQPVETGWPTITWDPHSAFELSNGVIMSPATVLEHEARHAADYWDYRDKGNLQSYWKENKRKDVPCYGNTLEKAAISESEQWTSKANGEISPGQVTRSSHGRGSVNAIHKVSGPTSTQPLRRLYYRDIFTTTAPANLSEGIKCDLQR